MLGSGHYFLKILYTLVKVEIQKRNDDQGRLKDKVHKTITIAAEKIIKSSKKQTGNFFLEVKPSHFICTLF